MIFRLLHGLLPEMQNVEEISFKSSCVALWEILPYAVVPEIRLTAKKYKYVGF